MKIDGNVITITENIKPSSTDELIFEIEKMMRSYSYITIRILSFSMSSKFALFLIDNDLVVQVKCNDLLQLLKDIGIRVRKI